MISLYDQLIALRKLDKAREMWKDYREELTSFIKGHTDPGSTAMIIGAGACNDIDLSVLKDHFSKVLLTDRDEKSMLDAVGVFEAVPENIRMQRIDLLGIPDEAYRAIDEDVQNSILKEKFTGNKDVPQRVFLAGMERAFKNRRIETSGSDVHCADHVICCGVHSQLLAMFAQMAGIFGRYTRMDRVFPVVSAMNRTVSSELNSFLFKAASKSVILGLETQRLGIEGGIEGAEQAFSDLERRSFIPDRETEMIWSFDRSQEKMYRMRIMQFIKKESIL